MSLPYEKWDATGNDFVIIDLALSPLAEHEISPELVRALCDRVTGVGADGVVLLGQAQVEDQPSRVVIWNSDGSLGGMCGNALRCVALVLARCPGPEWRSVLIGERLVQTRVEATGPSIAMGPVGQVGSLPAYSSLDELDAVLGGRGYLLSFGNPHYVVPCQELPPDWAELGARAQAVAHQLLGTGGINCGFLRLSATSAESGYPLRVFERGVGVTKSCGSGACAASAVLENRLAVSPPHRLELLGGRLAIGRVDGVGYELTGPASLERVGSWSLS